MTQISEIKDRLDRLAKRREDDGIYTDAALCREASALLSALAHPLHQPAPEAGNPDRHHDIARIVIDAVRNTRKRPAGLRGPYIFDNAELDEIIASYDTAPANAPVPDGVTDEMVEKAIAAYDRIYKVEFPARGSWVTNHRDAMRAALTAVNERSR